MAISFVAKSAFASGTAGLTVGAVSGTASGDLILLFVESANEAVTTPSGYTIVTGAQVSAGTAAAAGGMLLNVLYKWATGSDTTTTVADTGNHTTAIKLAYRGVDSTTPFDATPTTGTKTTASTSSTYPAITTATENALVVYASALDLDAASTATTSAQANANLTSLTERHDQTVTSGAGGGIVITDGFKAAAGSSGTMSATVTSTRQVYITLALRPQGAVTHDTSGALVGQEAVVDGSAIVGPHIKQSVYTAPGDGSGATKIAGTITGITAGNAIIAFVGFGQPLTLDRTCTVSDGVAYTADSAGRIDDTTNFSTGQVFYLANAGGGSHTVTATFSSSATYRRLLLLEVAGVATSSIEDKAAGQAQNGVGITTDSIASPATAATTNAKDLVLGFQQDTGSTDTGGTVTAGTGFTRATNGTLLVAEGKYVSSTGAQTATFTDTINSGRTAHVLALKAGSSGPVTHTSTGALVGSDAVVSGSAQHLALHPSSGALVGQGSTVTGSANRFRAHDSNGTLVGQGAAVTGSASRSTGAVSHATSGVLVGQGSAVSGSANRFRQFATSGALVGQGSAISGAANRYRQFAASGALLGQGATIVGVAQHNIPHVTNGALVGPGATIAGTTLRFRAHYTSGALVGQGAVVAGTAQHNVPHTTTGALVGSGSAVVGSASRNQTVVTHDTTGALVGVGAVVAGAANRFRQHDASGALVGQGAVIAGISARYRQFSATGAIVGAGSLVSGAAARMRAHDATGALSGQGAAISGAASRAGAPPNHVCSGALVGQGSAVSGTAAHVAIHTTTGALTGQGAAITGSARRYRQLTTGGALIGLGASLSGIAAHLAKHATSGALIGPGATINGSASRIAPASTHECSGALVGAGAGISGLAHLNLAGRVAVAASRSRQLSATARTMIDLPIPRTTSINANARILTTAADRRDTTYEAIP